LVVTGNRDCGKQGRSLREGAKKAKAKEIRGARGGKPLYRFAIWTEGRGEGTMRKGPDLIQGRRMRSKKLVIGMKRSGHSAGKGKLGKENRKRGNGNVRGPSRKAGLQSCGLLEREDHGRGKLKREGGQKEKQLSPPGEKKNMWIYGLTEVREGKKTEIPKKAPQK